MQRILFVSLVSFGGLIMSPAYAADCQVDHYNFVFGQDTSTHMTVKAGKSCGSTIRVGNGGLTSLAIAQQAQGGTAMTPSSMRWEYRSKPGYSGKDAFVVQAAGESMSKRGGAPHSGNVNINVDVDVVQ